MLYIDFLKEEGMNAYAAFKSIYGEKSSRNNKVALAYMMHLARKHFAQLDRIKSKFDFCARRNNSVVTHILYGLQNGRCTLNGTEFRPSECCSRQLDEYRGVRVDGGLGVRFIKDGREMASKTGKFVRGCLMEMEETKDLPQSVINYVTEQIANQFDAANPNAYQYSLEIGSSRCDFERIYSSDYCASGMGSCMEDKGYDGFYFDAVQSARAAWLEDEDGVIVARCIIFDKCHDEEGNVYRLAERQYAKDKSPVLKKMLINKLIEAGEIDGYKKVDASYNDRMMFYLNDGTPLSCPLRIKCHLEHGDTISYQDSFNLYDEEGQWAYNSNRWRGKWLSGSVSLGDLATTSGEYDSPNKRWDSINGEWCRETINVQIWRDGYYSDETDNIENEVDYYEIDGEYYDDVCEYNGKYYPWDDTVYSAWHECDVPECLTTYNETMNDYILSEDADKIFEEWKEQNWEYDELNDCYVEDTITVYIFAEEKDAWVEKETTADYNEDDFVDFEYELFLKSDVMKYGLMSA